MADLKPSPQLNELPSEILSIIIESIPFSSPLKQSEFSTVVVVFDDWNRLWTKDYLGLRLANKRLKDAVDRFLFKNVCCGSKSGYDFSSLKYKDKFLDQPFTLAEILFLHPTWHDRLFTHLFPINRESPQNFIVVKNMSIQMAKYVQHLYVETKKITNSATQVRTLTTPLDLLNSSCLPNLKEITINWDRVSLGKTRMKKLKNLVMYNKNRIIIHLIIKTTTFQVYEQLSQLNILDHVEDISLHTFGNDGVLPMDTYLNFSLFSNLKTLNVDTFLSTIENSPYNTVCKNFSALSDLDHLESLSLIDYTFTKYIESWTPPRHLKHLTASPRFLTLPIQFHDDRKVMLTHVHIVACKLEEYLDSSEFDYEFSSFACESITHLKVSYGLDISEFRKKISNLLDSIYKNAVNLTNIHLVACSLLDILSFCSGDRRHQITHFTMTEGSTPDIHTMSFDIVTSIMLNFPNLVYLDVPYLDAAHGGIAHHDIDSDYYNFLMDLSRVACVKWPKPLKTIKLNIFQKTRYRNQDPLRKFPSIVVNGRKVLSNEFIYQVFRSHTYYNQKARYKSLVQYILDIEKLRALNQKA